MFLNKRVLLVMVAAIVCFGLSVCFVFSNTAFCNGNKNINSEEGSSLNSGVSGLELKVKFSKKKYDEYEPILARVILKNTTSEVKVILQPKYGCNINSKPIDIGPTSFVGHSYINLWVERSNGIISKSGFLKNVQYFQCSENQCSLKNTFNIKPDNVIGVAWGSNGKIRGDYIILDKNESIILTANYRHFFQLHEGKESRRRLVPGSYKMIVKLVLRRPNVTEWDLKNIDISNEVVELAKSAVGGILSACGSFAVIPATQKVKNVLSFLASQRGGIPLSDIENLLGKPIFEKPLIDEMQGGLAPGSTHLRGIQYLYLIGKPSSGPSKYRWGKTKSMYLTVNVNRKLNFDTYKAFGWLCFTPFF